MNPKFVPVLRCPEADCHGDVRIAARETEHAGQVVRGTLECRACGRTYRIRDGFPILLPDSMDDEAADLGEER